jgi:hypothetical protein
MAGYGYMLLYTSPLSRFAKLRVWPGTDFYSEPSTLIRNCRVPSTKMPLRAAAATVDSRNIMPVEVDKKIRAPNPGGTLCKNDARHFQDILTVYGTRSHSLMFESVLPGLLR